MLPNGYSLAYLIEQLVALEQRVAAQAATDHGMTVRVYPWRPPTIEPPAIYNWLSPSTAEFRDTTSHSREQTFNIAARCAVPNTDSDEQMSRLAKLGDTFREVVEAAIVLPQPLNDAAKWIDLPTVAMVPDEFAGQPYLALEFAVSARQKRMVTPNP